MGYPVLAVLAKTMPALPKETILVPIGYARPFAIVTGLADGSETMKSVESAAFNTTFVLSIANVILELIARGCKFMFRLEPAMPSTGSNWSDPSDITL